MVSIDYYKGGNKRTGEERIKGFFAANFNRMTGIGLDMDYLIGRGRYDSQSTSFFDTRLYTYHRRDKYSIYITANRDKMKVTENGGIQNPYYITNPEAMAEGRKQYSAEDIPFRLYYNWNNLDRYQGLINHSLLISRTEYRTDSIADTVITRRREIEFAKIAHTLEVGVCRNNISHGSCPNSFMNAHSSTTIPLTVQKLLSDQHHSLYRCSRAPANGLLPDCRHLHVTNICALPCPTHWAAAGQKSICAATIRAT